MQPSATDPMLVEFATLVAKALTAGLFGMKTTSPSMVHDSLDSGRIHAASVVLARNDHGVETTKSI